MLFVMEHVLLGCLWQHGFSQIFFDAVCFGTRITPMPAAARISTDFYFYAVCFGTRFTRMPLAARIFTDFYFDAVCFGTRITRMPAAARIFTDFCLGTLMEFDQTEFFPSGG
jgi:hypothetical protein